jgi:hypothetical protein
VTMMRPAKWRPRTPHIELLQSLSKLPSLLANS